MILQKQHSSLERPNTAGLMAMPQGSKAEAAAEFGRAESKVRSARKPSGHVEIEADLCKGCLLCIEACPPEVLLVSKSLNKMGYHPVKYLGERCTGCGICFYICPEPRAIRVYKRMGSQKQ